MGLVGAACATVTNTKRQDAPFVLDDVVTINGTEVSRKHVSYGPFGNCKDEVSMYTNPANQFERYSVVTKTCDVDKLADGVADYRESTRVGRGETKPYQVQLRLAEGQCVTVDYDTATNQVTKVESVACKKLDSE